VTIVERHNIAIFLTAGLGILIYVVADGSLGLGLFAMAAWAVSWPLAQGPKGKTLPRPVVTAMVLVATAQVLLTILSAPADLIVAISRYLVWLHLIKLYDKTGPRDKGQILMMSVFLVLGATLTSSHLSVGLLMLIYLPVLLYTAVLHQMSLGERDLSQLRERLRPLDRRRFLTGETAGRTRARDVAFVVTCSGILVAIIAVGVFVTVPRRVGAGVVANLQAPSLGSVTGFREEVQLGAEGLISESAAQVFEMTLTDGTGENVGAEWERVLIRGAVLDEYENGQWRRSDRADQGRPPKVDTTLPNARSSLPPGVDNVDPNRVLRQRYQFRNKQIGSLFTIYRPVSFQYDDVARYSFSLVDQTLRLDQGGRLEYVVESVPDAPLPEWLASRDRMRPIFQEGPVRDFAVRILEREGLSRDPAQRHAEQDLQIARTLERFLQDNFMYTTRMIAPDRGEEPIEMFLFRTREGHCEYFASAMAAMCRSLGMDARVVTGYVAVEFEPGRGVFTVRESNAHAWTEVAVGPGDWRTFDPSPPASISDEHRPPGGVIGAMRNAYEQLERLWVNEVVAYEDSVTSGMFTGAKDSAFSSIARRIDEGLRMGPVGQLPERILRALVGGLGVFGVVAAIGLGGVRLFRIARATLANWLARRRLAATNPELLARREESAFARDLLARLEKQVCPRPAGQTPRQYLESLAGADAALRQLSDRIIGLYYACRFGGRSLSEQERDEARSMGRRFVEGVASNGRARPAPSG